jgi:energy-coupling factor transport system permease protein
MNWKLREVVVTAVLSVVCGAVYMGWDFLFQAVGAGLSPITSAAFNGFWWIASGLVAYIVRKPGAALLAEAIGGLAEFAFGSPYGYQAFTIGLAQGLGMELWFYITRYRSFSTLSLMAGAAIGGIGNTIYSYFAYGVNNYTVGMQIAYLLITMASGAILAGLLPTWVANALNRTGVLRNFEISKQNRKSSLTSKEQVTQ